MHVLIFDLFVLKILFKRLIDILQNRIKWDISLKNKASDGDKFLQMITLSKQKSDNLE